VLVPRLDFRNLSAATRRPDGQRRGRRRGARGGRDAQHASEPRSRRGPPPRATGAGTKSTRRRRPWGGVMSPSASLQPAAASNSVAIWSACSTPCRTSAPGSEGAPRRRCGAACAERRDGSDLAARRADAPASIDRCGSRGTATGSRTGSRTRTHAQADPTTPPVATTPARRRLFGGRGSRTGSRPPPSAPGIGRRGSAGTRPGRCGCWPGGRRRPR